MCLLKTRSLDSRSSQRAQSADSGELRMMRRGAASCRPRISTKCARAATSMKRLSTRWRDPTRRTSAAAPPKHSPTAHHRPLPAEQVSDRQARAILITASGGGLPGVQAKDYKDVLEDLTRLDIKGLPDGALELLAAAAGKKDSAQGIYTKDGKASDAYKRVQGSINGLGQFAFVKMITDAGWNPSAVAPARNVKDLGCAIQLLTNHRICVLEGLNADRDDSSFIEVSTPLEKLVRARLESGRALAIPSAPFPLPAAPALGHAAHPPTPTHTVVLRRRVRS